MASSNTPVFVTVTRLADIVNSRFADFALSSPIGPGAEAASAEGAAEGAVVAGTSPVEIAAPADDAFPQ